MELIRKYFPNLTEQQEEQFLSLAALYQEWNQKINVISRKDIDNIYCHHILHSLAIAKLITFQPATSIMDLGTGGGFPGIPLAVMFPECHFTLIDSVGKKIRVAQEVASAAGLKNVTCVQERAEEEKKQFDFIVSRAVMTLRELYRLTRKNLKREQHNAMPNGLICLKGGELQAEIQPFKNIVEVTNISTFFDEEYFKTKKIVYLPG